MQRLLPETLALYVGLARPILIETARKGAKIKYGELIGRMDGPGRGYIAEVLESIADYEQAANRPKLTSVVVRSDTEAVGGGFFGLKGTPANLLRTTPGELQSAWLSEADLGYWLKELNAAYEYWKSD